jgi:hypothetical protein
MTQKAERVLDLSAGAHVKAGNRARALCLRWQALCAQHLPVKSENSIWRYNRKSRPYEPAHGWKLHISATILEACDLFERVAPLLSSADVQFKAPNSLAELSKINCGLQYGYHQVGKFITVYPSSEKQSLELAQRLDELTREFFTICVPFDEQYAPGSSVFYRYGAFSNIKATDENGETFKAILNPAGEFVPDDRRRAVPEWIFDPFPNSGKPNEKTFAGTPLETTYKVFQAITQRGKGGTYLAIDLSQNAPRLCVLKEGRHKGELAWNEQDGYFLVRNEFEVLRVLRGKCDAVPKVFASFDIYGNFYFAMEYVEGQSLSDAMKPRRRRFAVRQILRLAVEIAKTIEEIHSAGWVWNDCKPANLIVAENGALRPIDFENAYPEDRTELFDWKSKGFSKPSNAAEKAGGKSVDLYALGAVIYFLLTGKLYDAEKSEPVKKMRRGVPPALTEITERLLFESGSDISKVRRELEKALNTVSSTV